MRGRGQPSSRRSAVTAAVGSRRRSIEYASVVARCVGILSEAYGFTLLGSAAHWPTARALIRIVLICVLLAGTGLGLVAARMLDHRWYPATSVVQLVLDSDAIIGTVALFNRTPGLDIAVWPLLVVPVFIGALRYQLAGSLAIWILIAAAQGAMYLADLAGHDFELGLTDMVLGVNISLMAAVMTGMQGRALLRQLDELDTVRAALH